jgi:hypothetical protein
VTAWHRCRIFAAWAGWVETKDGAREPLNNGANLDDIDAEAFPGRWSPLRSFPPELEPLPGVVGKTLADAGVWQPGSGEACAGGLVVGADGAFLPPSKRFARAIASGYSSSLSPSDFIHALPSTATSLLTKLFGFADYQATVLQGASSGVRALGHALDLVVTRRLERALVAVLSVSTVRVAVAVYLEPEARGAGVRTELTIRKAPPTSTLVDAAPQSRDLRRFGELAALPLIELARALDSHRGDGSSLELVCPDGRGERLSVGLRFP